MSSADGASLPTAFLVLFWPAFCLVLLCMCLATMRGAADAKLELLMTQMLMTQDKLELLLTRMLDSSSAWPQPAADHKLENSNNLENLITRLIDSIEKRAPIREESASQEVGCQTQVKSSLTKICSGIVQQAPPTNSRISTNAAVQAIQTDIGRVPQTSGESFCRVSSAETLRFQPVWTGSMPQLSDAYDSQHAAAAADKGTSLHASSLRSIPRRPRPVSVDEALNMMFSGRCVCLCICQTSAVHIYVKVKRYLCRCKFRYPVLTFAMRF